MILKIISADAVVFEGGVTSVLLPGVKGSFMVLKNHASLISTLSPGNIVYVLEDGGESRSVEIEGGVADVDNNVVSVCLY